MIFNKDSNEVKAKLEKRKGKEKKLKLNKNQRIERGTLLKTSINIHIQTLIFNK